MAKWLPSQSGGMRLQGLEKAWRAGGCGHDLDHGVDFAGVSVCLNLGNFTSHHVQFVGCQLYRSKAS